MASRPLRLTFRTEVQVPEEGLVLRLPSGAQVEGLAAPTIHNYRNSAGERFERYDPRELWYATQFTRKWVDGDGNTIVIGIPTAQLPTRFLDEHVDRAEFEAKQSELAGVPTNLASFSVWAESFAGAKLATPARVLPAGGARLQQVIAFQFAGEPARNGYAFRFRANPFGVRPEQWFFILFEWTGDVDPSAAAPTLEREFLPTLGVMARAGVVGDAAKVKYQNQAVAAALATNRSSALDASRQAVINNIRGRRGWWFVETPNYVLVSDLPGAQAGAVRRIQSDVEFLRSAFSALIPPRKPIDAVSVIRAFGTGEGYLEYIGPGYEWSGGVWMPSKRELVIRPLEWGSPRDRKEWLLGTVYHEAFHQYLSYAMDFREVSIWFNEGHATLFEGSEIRDGKLTLDEVERYVGAVERIVREQPERVWSLFAMTPYDFYGGGSETGDRGDNYALAWGITYFFRKGVPSGGGPAHYAGILDRYIDVLWEVKDPAQATQAALHDIYAEPFTKDFREFWTSSAKRAAARRYDPFASKP